MISKYVPFIQDAETIINHFYSDKSISHINAIVDDKLYSLVPGYIELIKHLGFKYSYSKDVIDYDKIVEIGVWFNDRNELLFEF